MTLTITQARDSMLSFFRVAWLAAQASVNVPVFWPDAIIGSRGVGNERVTEPISGTPWARVSLQHATGAQASLADQNSKKIFVRNGVLTVQIFTPYGTGLTESDSLVKVVQDAFEGKATSEGVWFRNVRANEFGQDGEWHQTNVLVEFTYDEVK